MKVNLHSSQRIKDPTDSGGYILVSNFGVGYEHHWLVDRFSTLVDYSYITEDYKHQSNKRKDKSNLLSLTFNYDFRPSVNFKLKLQWNTMHSNKDTDTFYIGPDYSHAVDRTRLRRFGHYFYDAGTTMTFLNRTLVMLPLLALLLAGCSTPPQTIKTPPDAVYLWTGR